MCLHPPGKWQLPLAIVMVAVMFSIVGTLYFFLFFDKPFLSYKNLPFPPVVQHVAPGEIVALTVHRCNSKDRPQTYTTTHTLVNVHTNQFWILPNVTVAIQPGCILGTSLVNRVPEGAPPGLYKLFGMAEVPGVFRQHHVEWYTASFFVKEAPK